VELLYVLAVLGRERLLLDLLRELLHGIEKRRRLAHPGLALGRRAIRDEGADDAPLRVQPLGLDALPVEVDVLRLAARALTRRLTAVRSARTSLASRERAGLPLLGAIPEDAYLAEDQFATQAPTVRAIDALIRRIA